MPKQSREDIFRAIHKAEKSFRRFDAIQKKGRPLNPWESFVEDTRLEFKICWVEFLHSISIIVAYAIFGGMFFWLLPYLAEWLVSFP